MAPGDLTSSPPVSPSFHSRGRHPSASRPLHPWGSRQERLGLLLRVCVHVCKRLGTCVWEGAPLSMSYGCVCACAHVCKRLGTCAWEGAPLSISYACVCVRTHACVCVCVRVFSETRCQGAGQKQPCKTQRTEATSRPSRAWPTEPALKPGPSPASPSLRAPRPVPMAPLSLPGGRGSPPGQRWRHAD